MKGIKVLLVSSVAAIGFASCADLGFGVDMDSGISSPYYYGSGIPYYGGYNGGPYFGLSTIRSTARSILPAFCLRHHR